MPASAAHRKYQLAYGAAGLLELEFPAGARVTECLAPRGAPLANVEAAVAQALAHPLDYPPLVEATVPGDQVALGVNPAVPQAAAVVAAVVKSLLAGGRTQASDISLVHASTLDSGAADILALLEEPVRGQIKVVAHNPADQGSLMFLAPATDARPIYVNRALGDAGVVVSLGCLQLPGLPGYYGIHTSLFPTFTDTQTQAHSHAPTGRKHMSDHRRQQEAVEEAARLLGYRFTVQVVPGANNEVLHVLAGDVDAVERQGRAQCEAAWQYAVPGPADLVVAALGGGTHAQTWANLARALAVAATVVQEGGAVVLATELTELPARILRAVGRIEDDEVAEKLLRRDHSADLPLGALLLSLRRRVRVYLLSSLDADAVEDTGLVPLNNAAALAPLVRRSRVGLLVGNAQYARPVVAK